MTNIARHIGVFCLILIIASITAFFMPAAVDAKWVLYAGVFVFLLYLCIIYYRVFRSPDRTQSKR